MSQRERIGIMRDLRQEAKELAEETPYVESDIEEHYKFVEEYEKIHGKGSWNKSKDGGEFT